MLVGYKRFHRPPWFICRASNSPRRKLLEIFDSFHSNERDCGFRMGFVSVDEKNWSMTAPEFRFTPLSIRGRRVARRWRVLFIWWITSGEQVLHNQDLLSCLFIIKKLLNVFLDGETFQDEFDTYLLTELMRINFAKSNERKTSEKQILKIPSYGIEKLK